MSLKKQFLKSKPVCKVTFKLTPEEAKNADSVRLLGDFNDWDKRSQPMKKLKNGGFTATVALETGKDYQFRYLLNDHEWENDWAADNYMPSPQSYDDNSVVSC
ncbi:isoamylase early set domain-containing protein [Paraneptunicella aestuarii]|uniref:isoamylase early set domain-containing protein n=1 Tax=Paraneptunicella aestuarii TaxID=2831148 RepID=UPI001E38C36C|nr:isoamylase early set domain-containing protein [Paraneptunicella aestuarii]UAA40505.1 isoamylase early set domain-containing protein [Paraneptunicella aestuarii]